MMMMVVLMVVYEEIMDLGFNFCCSEGDWEVDYWDF